MYTPNSYRRSIMPLGRLSVATGVLLISCLLIAMPVDAAPDIAGSKVVADINEGLNSNEGGTMISIVKDTTDTALGNSAIAQNSAAWRSNKMGASSSTVGGHLEIRDGLKGASDILNKGGVLIDHAGYASTAAGEIAEGNYTQGFITIADGLGKSVVTGIASATGASFGSLLGPAGTVGGGAAAGYTAGWAWDKTFGRLNAAIKDGLGVQEDKARFRELAGPKMLGMTPEKIHENWLAYKKQLDEKKNLAAKEKEKKTVAPVAQTPKAKETQVAKPSAPPPPGASGPTASRDKATPVAQPQSGKDVATSKPQTPPAAKPGDCPANSVCVTNPTADPDAPAVPAKPAPPDKSGGSTSLTLQLPGFWGHLNYTITGAQLDPPSGSDRGKIGGRSYTGKLSGNTLSVSGTAISDNESSGEGSGDYYKLSVEISAGKDSKTFEYIAPKGEKMSKPYSLSVPIAPGTTSGSFSIKLLEVNRNYGDFGWVVSGSLSSGR